MRKFIPVFIIFFITFCFIACEFNQQLDSDYVERRKKEIVLACLSESVIDDDYQVQKNVYNFLSSAKSTPTITGSYRNSSIMDKNVAAENILESYSITDTQTIVYGGVSTFNNRSIENENEESLENEDLLIYLMKVKNDADQSYNTVISSNDKRVGSILASYPIIQDEVEEDRIPSEENLFTEYDFEYAKIFLSSITQYVKDTIAIYNSISKKNVSDIKKNQSQYSSVSKVIIDDTILKTQWHQNKPFNKLVSFNEGKNVVVGCVSLACAQLAAMHQSPKQCYEYPFEGVSYDWESIKEPRYTSLSKVENEDSICVLLYETGLATKTQYGESSSSAFFPDAFDYFRSRGYSTPPLPIIYNIESIKRSLSNGNPVLVGGFSSILLNDGHSWIIDGYMKEETGLEYVHFNLGWGGLYDGYYLSDIFESCSGLINSLTNKNNTSEIVKNYKYGVMIIPDICPE